MAFGELDAMEKGEAGESITKSPSDLSFTPSQLGSTSCFNLVNSSQRNQRREDVTAPTGTGSIAPSGDWVSGCFWINHWWERKLNQRPLIVRSRKLNYW